MLIQAKRAGSGIALIDPETLPSIEPFVAAIAGSEWILHAATQDLECLAEVGMKPESLFDTELAARMLNYPKVGLAALTEALLGVRLSKGHSAADWSVRPLPASYLRYAALDVELLHELKDILTDQLLEAGKWEWAQAEFATLVHWQAPAKVDPWRRVSRIHTLKDRRALAVARQLWLARDAVAQQVDRAPGRVLPDAAIIAAAAARPQSRGQLLALPEFRRGRRIGTWWAAVQTGLATPEEDLPPLALDHDGPPPTRLWARKDEAAAGRYQAVRAAVLATSDRVQVPAEVLIAPDAVRRLAWEPPAQPDPEVVADFLRGQGARDWQIALVAGPLAAALNP